MKKNRTLFLLILILANTAYAQTENCNCKTDLQFLDAKVRKTPAYSVNKDTYKASYSKVLNEVASVNTMFDCHALLNKLLISLNDNHSKVYSIDLGASEKIIANSEKFDAFRKSQLFNAYPKPNIDLDSLKTELNTKPKSVIEGIYTRESYMTIGVFRTEDYYQAIILNSESDMWKVGEIMSTLIPFGNDYLLNVGGGISSKRLIAYTERVENGFFYYMGFQKDLEQTNYSAKLLSESTYYREELSDDITYLKIGSFSSWNPNLSEAEKFYKTLEGNLNKSHIILDLRNNGGGGDRNSDILYKLLKEYLNENKVYVLINHRSVSNAEQFAERLSKLENCQLLGMRTNGTLAYEIKDGSYTLPCSNFIAVLTSKKHSKYLGFESEGVKPHIALNMEADWIDQAKNYIEANQ